MVGKKKFVKTYKAYEYETGKKPKTVEMLKYSGFRNEKEAKKWAEGFEKRFEKMHDEIEDMRKEFFGKFAELPKLLEIPELFKERKLLPEPKKKKKIRIK